MTTIKRNLLVGGLAVVALLVLAGGIYYAWLITPPDLPTSAAEGMAVMGSARFKRMPEYRQEEYATRMRELVRELPTDQRQQFFEQMHDDEAARQSMREMMRRMMEKRMQQFSEADEAERRRMLDQIIDRQESRSGREGANRSGRGGRDPARMREHIQNHIETGNPQHAGLMMEFRKALRDRRAQRGLEPNPSRGGPPG